MANSPGRARVDVGAVIADTYTLEGLLGSGGMGAVFIASHNRLPGKKVAIKLLHAELSDAEVIARFRREALIASQLDHPNIVGVTDFNVTHDGVPYLVLEYLHGETLAQRLSLGPLPLDQAMSILRQVGSAVAAAHRAGIVHRDLKPQNIFLIPTEVAGTSVEIAKVLDFGISKIAGSSTVQTQENTLLGTPQYMAPEQATGRHADVDARTDIFALGAIAYEMVSGAPAFSGANIPEVVFKVVYEAPPALAGLVPHLPASVVAAIERAMAKPRDDRFASVGELVEALTGHPLPTLRAPAITQPSVGFAAGSRHPRNTDHDAYAQTMGSIEQSVPPLSGPPLPVARTVAHPAANQATIATPSPRRRSPAVVAGLVLGGLAVAAAVALLVARQLTAPAPQPPPPPVAATPVAPPIATPPVATPPVATPPVATPEVTPDAAVAATPPVAAPDAAVAIAEAAPAPDAGPTRPRARAAVEREPAGDPPDEPDTGGDAQVAELLASARAAITGGDSARAERLANTVINAPAATARQRGQAHLLRGIIECKFNNNQEGANIALRNLPNPRQRRQLTQVCAAAGIQLSR